MFAPRDPASLFAREETRRQRRCRPGCQADPAVWLVLPTREPRHFGGCAVAMCRLLRGDGVRGNATRTYFLSDAGDELFHGRLTRCIQSVASGRVGSVESRDIDDPSVMAQVPRRTSKNVEAPAKISVHHECEVIVGNLAHHRRRIEDSRVVDHDVHPPPFNCRTVSKSSSTSDGTPRSSRIAVAPVRASTSFAASGWEK